MSETKSSTGMEQNIASLLCYVLGFITGIVFILIEKDNKVVRFHAFQSLFTFLPLFILQYVLAIVLGAILPGIVFTLISLALLGLMIFLIVKAFQNQMIKLPIVGDLAAKQAGV
ncbi:MAG: DUF4870 domain-containing protein [Cellvibrio sp.]|jgi:uncharacterized membrane protein|nr:DUF4870 domain-containing protein [Cellvibrio sp.]